MYIRNKAVNIFYDVVIVLRVGEFFVADNCKQKLKEHMLVSVYVKKKNKDENKEKR